MVVILHGVLMPEATAGPTSVASAASLSLPVRSSKGDEGFQSATFAPTEPALVEKGSDFGRCQRLRQRNGRLPIRPQWDLPPRPCHELRHL